MAKGRWAAAVISATVCARSGAQVFLGFDTNPVVPTNDPDLVVEQMWQFEGDAGVIQLQWVPNSDQIITVQRAGILRLYDSIDVDVTAYTTLYDMQADVYGGGTDLGLMSIALSPDFTATGGSAFLLYAGNPKEVELLPNLAAVEALRTGFGPTGYFDWMDTCPNENGVCEHPYYIDRVIIDLVAGTAVKDITLLTTECGAASGHGPGTILLVGNDLVWSQGDGSPWEIFDYGNDLDGCFDPDATDVGFQGCFRSQRDDNPNGKVHRIPYALLESPTELEILDMEVVAKGLRNPFRMFYHNETDALFIGDVGLGEPVAGTTSERIFRHDAISTTKVANNYGWPCVEGIRSAPNGPYALFDSGSEQLRLAYLQGAGITGCDATYAAAEDYVLTVDTAYVRQASTANAVADPTWAPPLFEYRTATIDMNYPDVCQFNTGASITNVHIYDGVLAPASISGKLIFADATIGCAWYFENNADGTPNTDVNPTVLLSGVGIVDIRTGADGYLYALDWNAQRVIRMYQNGLGPYGGNTAAPTWAPGSPTSAPTIPFVEPPVNAGAMCAPAYDIPEIEWTTTGVNTYSGDLALSAANFNFIDGTTMRTRAWNGQLPGPIMRLKPCSIYNLRVTNDQEGWPNPEGNLNSLHSPATSNLHLHGLHISGEAPGDNPFISILPRDSYDYTYNIPCDHVGGTHLYHTHSHGSVALQTDSGAIGMLIIDPSAREASDMPYEYQAMPELMLTIQEFSPKQSIGWALDSGDALFQTTIVDDFTLVNGCAIGGVIELEAGQWTKLRILRSGLTYNAMLELASVIPTDAQCDIALLAKDGVPLSVLPRMLLDNRMFMSLSSRIDVAVRCPLEGSSHTILHRHVNTEGGDIVVNINVLPSLRLAAEDLPEYTPCRPAYLQDLESLVTYVDHFEIRPNFADDAGTYSFEGESGPAFRSLTIDEAVEWNIIGTESHPLHIHINHMQLGNITDLNQWSDVPDWLQPGDWVDTLSVASTAAVYLRPVDFNGTMLMHCHIAEHSDDGIMVINDIIGAGYDVAFPVLTDYGTCNATVPTSQPYNGLPAAIPGTILAAEFDLGGEAVAYHNINIATNAGNSIRPQEAVEIRSTDGITNTVSYNREGEFLKYTVNVATAGTYTFSMNAYQDALDTGVASWSLWLGEDSCPPPTNTINLLAQSSLAAPATRLVTGTGYDNFMPIAGTATFTKTGDTTLLLCFDNSPTGYFALSSLVFV